MKLGKVIADSLQPEDVVELIGDLGAGKTQLVRGIVLGLGSEDPVQSPTYNVERVYGGGRLKVFHYDLHRLHDPGIVRGHLIDAMNELHGVVLIEWADTAKNILPDNRKIIVMTPTAETEREIRTNFEVHYDPDTKN